MAIVGSESPAWAEGERLTEAIYDGENVAAAGRAVQRNKGVPGIDGMTVEQLPGVVARHWPRIARELGRWTLSPATGETGSHPPRSLAAIDPPEAGWRRTQPSPLSRIPCFASRGMRSSKGLARHPGRDRPWD